MSYKEIAKENLAALSDYEVEQLIKTEMMEQGVRVVEKPSPFNELRPVLSTQKFYAVSGILFKTMSQAEKFLDLNPQKDDWSWNTTSEFRYSEPISSGIRVVELYVKEEVVERGDELTAWAAKKVEYDGKKSQYDNYCRSNGNIAKTVWNAVIEARKAQQERVEIQNAYEEYKELAGGDELIAQNFLFKTYGEEKARAAIDVPLLTEQAQVSPEEVNA